MHLCQRVQVSGFDFWLEACFQSAHQVLQSVKLITGLGSGLCYFTLLELYRSHVRSKLDSGSVVYGLYIARQSVLESLDRMQYVVLRTCLGAFRTSPVSSLHVEADELPLNCDVSVCVYNISLNFDQVHATLLSVVYLVLVSDVCLRLDLTLGIRMDQNILGSENNLWFFSY